MRSCRHDDSRITEGPGNGVAEEDRTTGPSRASIGPAGWAFPTVGDVTTALSSAFAPASRTIAGRASPVEWVA